MKTYNGEFKGEKTNEVFSHLVLASKKNKRHNGGAGIFRRCL